MARRYDRRTFIRGAALGGGAIVFLGTPPTQARNLRLARDAAFEHGVASGEPGPRAITLWSRLEGLEGPSLVGLEVARDSAFRNVLHRERLLAEAKLVRDRRHPHVLRRRRECERKAHAPRPRSPDPVNGPTVATEFVGGSITSQGIVDRAATSEAERNSAAAPADAAVLGNNPQIVYSNQAYKGYALVEAGEALHVRYRAVRESRQADSEVFTLRRFRVDAGRAAVIDEGGPIPLPAPSPPAIAPPGTPGIPPLPGLSGGLPAPA